MTRLIQTALHLVLLGAALISLPPGMVREQAVTQPDDAARLQAILDNAQAYCRKLETYAFYFVCREAVTEKLCGKTKVNVQDQLSATPSRAGVRPITVVSTIETDYLYDYQLIRKKDDYQEKRTLIEKNGQKTSVPDAKLGSMRFFYRNFAFGPVDIFGDAGRSRHDYKIVGRDKFKGEKAIVVEARSTGETAEYNPGGKVWVREGDNAILKIEWDQKTMAGFKDIAAAADALNAIPMFELVTEYGVEKNGIRFPSRALMREAYLRTKTRKIQKISEVTIDYKDYKFFQVDVETK